MTWCREQSPDPWGKSVARAWDPRMLTIFLAELSSFLLWSHGIGLEHVLNLVGWSFVFGCHPPAVVLHLPFFCNTWIPMPNSLLVSSSLSCSTCPVVSSLSTVFLIGVSWLGVEFSIQHFASSSHGSTLAFTNEFLLDVQWLGELTRVKWLITSATKVASLQSPLSKHHFWGWAWRDPSTWPYICYQRWCSLASRCW